MYIHHRSTNVLLCYRNEFVIMRRHNFFAALHDAATDAWSESHSAADLKRLFSFCADAYA